MALKAQNTISGKEGRLFLDGEEMAHIKTFEANVEKNKSEVNIMGRRMT
ncbi:phage tail tube protein, partial [Bacillus subtilis]